jgi:AAT family amino acid transporter
MSEGPQFDRAGLMLAMLITTLFTPGFRMTVICGAPFLVMLRAVYFLRARRVPAEAPVEQPVL